MANPKKDKPSTAVVAAEAPDATVVADDPQTAGSVNDDATMLTDVVGRVMEATERELGRIEAHVAQHGRPIRHASGGVIIRACSVGTARRANVSENQVAQVWAGVLKMCSTGEGRYVGWTPMFEHGSVGYPARQSQADGTGSRAGSWISTVDLMQHAPPPKSAAARGALLTGAQVSARMAGRGIDLASLDLFDRPTSLPDSPSDRSDADQPPVADASRDYAPLTGGDAGDQPSEGSEVAPDAS